MEAPRLGQAEAQQAGKQVPEEKESGGTGGGRWEATSQRETDGRDGEYTQSQCMSGQQRSQGGRTLGPKEGHRRRDLEEASEVLAPAGRMECTKEQLVLFKRVGEAQG